MKKLLLAATTLLLTIGLYSQTAKKSSPIKFRSINGVNYLAGSTDMQLGVSTVNGITWKQWFAGVGLSFDPYGHKGYAVYGSIQKYLGTGIWQPFINVDAGIYIPQRTPDYPDHSMNPDMPYYILNNTFYGGASFGVSKTIAGNNKLFVKLGVAYKRFNVSQSGGFLPYPSDIGYEYVYTPFSFSIGFML